jgi:hypothetical protein
MPHRRGTKGEFWKEKIGMDSLTNAQNSIKLQVQKAAATFKPFSTTFNPTIIYLSRKNKQLKNK